MASALPPPGGSGGSTVTKPDGTTITTEKDPITGTVTEVTKRPDGSSTTVETQKDGTTTTTNKTPTGTTGTVTTDKNGNITQAEVQVSSKDVEQSQKDDQPVKLPATVPVTPDGENAPSIEIDIPKGSGTVKVEIPVKNPTTGTVAVVVKPNGVKVPVKQSIVTENGVLLPPDGSAVIKIVDRSLRFVDVHGADHWAKEYVDFVTARDLFHGTSDTNFSPNRPITRGMLVAVLYRLADNPSLPEENLGYPFGDVEPDDWYSDAVHGLPTMASSAATMTGGSAPTTPSPGSRWRPFCTAMPSTRTMTPQTGRRWISSAIPSRSVPGLLTP